MEKISAITKGKYAGCGVKSNATLFKEATTLEVHTSPDIYGKPMGIKLGPSTIESYELLDNDTKFSVSEGIVGGLLFGGGGSALGFSSRCVVGVRWKGGEKSVIEFNEADFTLFKKIMF